MVTAARSGMSRRPSKDLVAEILIASISVTVAVGRLDARFSFGRQPALRREVRRSTPRPASGNRGTYTAPAPRARVDEVHLTLPPTQLIGPEQRPETIPQPLCDLQHGAYFGSPRQGPPCRPGSSPGRSDSDCAP